MVKSYSVLEDFKKSTSVDEVTYIRMYSGFAIGDTSTLAEPEVVDDLIKNSVYRRDLF